MFCSECGVEATGKYCWDCGKPLKQPGTQLLESHDDIQLELISDWTLYTDCQALIAVPQVRERIAHYAAQAKKKLSGEDFLECCDQILGPLTGGVPFALIAKLTQPISEKLGLKTGKGRCERLAEPPGTVLVAILCSMAQNGQKLLEATQSPNGCAMRATMPSDIWSLKGDLLVTVHTEGNTMVVEADITIPGQVYDWGKCNRALDRLFADMAQLAKVA
jgi:hypothetical protein